MGQQEKREIPIRFLDRHDEVLGEAAEEAVTSELGQTIDQMSEAVVETQAPEQEAVAGEAAEVARLREERDALSDRLLRLAAEFDNYRKRIEREREQILEWARADVISQILPIVDNFERALESARWVGDFTALVQGLDLIRKQFDDVLSRFGVRRIETIGQPFDPARHEAISTEERDDHEENTVIDEYQPGYMMGDRLLRPARVKVATRTSSPAPEEDR
jgi:molecular chaperone GrpE